MVRQVWVAESSLRARDAPQASRRSGCPEDSRGPDDLQLPQGVLSVRLDVFHDHGNEEKNSMCEQDCTESKDIHSPEGLPCVMYAPLRSYYLSSELSSPSPYCGTGGAFLVVRKLCPPSHPRSHGQRDPVTGPTAVRSPVEMGTFSPMWQQK